MPTIAFAVNPKVLADADALMPTFWKDLGNPAHKGLMGMADPNSSGTAYVVIATLIQLFGEQDAFNLLGDMYQSMASYTKSGSAALGPVGQGELGIGVIFMSSILREIQNGFRIEIVLPAEGTGYEISGVSLIKNSPNPEGGKAFIDYDFVKYGDQELQTRLIARWANENSPVLL